MINPAASLQTSPGTSDVPAASSPVPPAFARRKQLVYAAALVAVLLGIGWAARYYLTSKVQPQGSKPVTRFVVSSPLSLWATRSQKDVTITWDSSRPIVYDARVGVLTIKDSNEQTEVSLTKAQLQTNQFVYQSKGDFLEISFEVFAPGGKSALESIMLAAPQAGQPARSQSDPTAVEVTRTEPVARSTPPPPEIREALSTPSIKRFAAPPIRQAAPAVANVIADAPPPAAQTAAVDPARVRAPDFLAPAPLHAPAAPATATPATASANNSVTAPSAAPASAPASAPDMQQARPGRVVVMQVQPPKSLREVRPTLPYSVASMLKRPVDVQVRVFVDAGGKVTRAVPLIPSGGINSYLGAAAANAAKLWTFQPARRGDTPLASEMVLHFTFGPAK